MAPSDGFFYQDKDLTFQVGQVGPAPGWRNFSQGHQHAGLEAQVGAAQSAANQLADNDQLGVAIQEVARRAEQYRADSSQLGPYIEAIQTLLQWGRAGIEDRQLALAVDTESLKVEILGVIRQETTDGTPPPAITSHSADLSPLDTAKKAYSAAQQQLWGLQDKMGVSYQSDSQATLTVDPRTVQNALSRDECTRLASSLLYMRNKILNQAGQLPQWAKDVLKEHGFADSASKGDPLSSFMNLLEDYEREAAQLNQQNQSNVQIGQRELAQVLAYRANQEDSGRGASSINDSSQISAPQLNDVAARVLNTAIHAARLTNPDIPVPPPISSSAENRDPNVHSQQVRTGSAGGTVYNTFRGSVSGAVIQIGHIGHIDRGDVTH